MVLKRLGLVLSIWFCLLLVFSSAPALAQSQVASVQAQASDPTASRPAPTTPNSNSTYFPETGHYLGGTFRAYWQRYGGLAQFGLPLTEEFQELNPADGKVYTVQYFERNRFEYHPEFKNTFYEVLLGLLGRQATTGRTFPDAPAFTTTSRRFYFPETRHSLSNGFKTYWESRGGLAIYGYPISEEFQEGGYTVQYFERARFEYHPENRGTPYEVQLGLLGTNLLTATGRVLPQAFRVQPEPGSVVQGHALQVTVSAAGGQLLGSSLAGVKLNFFQQGDKQVAVAGVVSDAPLRPRLLVTEIKDASGVVRRFEQNIGVLAGQFEQQQIEVDPTVEASLGSDEEQARERARVYSFYNTVTPEKLWTGRFSWPLSVKAPITTPFGSRRNYVGGGYEVHDAIDFGVPSGTPILAPQRGRVVLAEFQKVRGGIVIIDHGLGVHTAYFHQSRIQVKVGDMVSTGNLIGYVGTTGLSTGPHLHWEMRLGSTGIDPEEWVGRNFIAADAVNLVNQTPSHSRVYRY